MFSPLRELIGSALATPPSHDERVDVTRPGRSATAGARHGLHETIEVLVVERMPRVPGVAVNPGVEVPLDDGRQPFVAVTVCSHRRTLAPADRLR